MFGRRKWKKRAERAERLLQEIEDIAVDAEMKGYAAKGSPAAWRYMVIANRIHLYLAGSVLYPDA